jgi:hypothetical protein
VWCQRGHGLHKWRCGCRLCKQRHGCWLHEGRHEGMGGECMCGLGEWRHKCMGHEIRSCAWRHGISRFKVQRVRRLAQSL